MSRIVAQFDPTPGSGNFSAAAVNRCSALLFMNESANFLTLDFGGAFPPTILQPWSNRLIRLAQPVQTVYWTVAATLSSADAPVSQVYVEAFDPSENLDGITSGPLFRQANVGNSVSVNSATETFERDLFTPFVYTGLIASADGSVVNQIDVTSGIAYPQQSDGSLLRQAPAASAWLTSAPGATYFLDLNPDGSWSWGTAHSTQSNYLTIAQVTTDGSSNVATVTDERQLNTVMLSQMAGNLIWNRITFQTAAKGGPVVMEVNGVLSANGLQAGAPVTLAAGNQETGFAGLRTVNSVSGQIYGTGVNFKTVLTNTPTSINSVIVSANNFTSFNILNYTVYGFSLEGPSGTAGPSTWLYIKYTTVGNCLLTLDLAARTLAHHCDACGHVTRGASFDRIEVTPGATSGAMGMRFVCPACGASEHFNCGLTAADEADETPQGSGQYATTRGAQATLIRQLMTALGLEVAA